MTKIANFADGDIRTSGGLAVGSGAGGDLSGGYPAPTVVGLGGIPMSGATPNDDDALVYDSGSGTWGPEPVGGGTAATTVTDETTWGITPAVGSDTEYARQDHTHGSPPDPGTGGGGEILISDTPAGSPLVFADLLQNDAGDDLLYADA